MKTDQLHPAVERDQQYCEECGRALNMKQIVWLELNTLTNRFTEDPVHQDDSQGFFPFGAACARAVLKRNGELTPR